MSKKCDKQKQVRLLPDVAEMLSDYRQTIAYPPSLPVLVNSILRTNLTMRQKMNRRGK